MSDLLPMAPCPTRKHGKHQLGIVIPESSEGYLTLYCELCGALRRVPAAGTFAAPLDEHDAATIVDAVRHAE